MWRHCWRRVQYQRFPGGAISCIQVAQASTSSRSSAAYCLDLVRRFDHEHYLCCLLLPPCSRAASITLRALNVELAQVKDVVSDKRIGEMRIQFWRDAIDLAFKGTPPQHPVAKELSLAIHRHQLSKHWLTRLLDARERELGVSTYLTTSDLEHHAEWTSSSLLYLTLQTLGVEDVSSDHAASHVGKAETITTLLRAVPYHLSRRTVLIPMDIISR
ncbi:NADH dehydrogenase (ubiquinone) complex I, assembly factor 6, partial [Geodia barretti]